MEIRQMFLEEQSWKNDIIENSIIENSMCGIGEKLSDIIETLKARKANNNFEGDEILTLPKGFQVVVSARDQQEEQSPDGGGATQ